MTKTTAPGASSGQFVDDNPGLGVVGTLITAADQNAHQDELYNAIDGAGITPSAASNAQLWLAIRKRVTEYSKHIGELFALPDRRAPVEWSVANADTYFPALCLTSIDTYTDISETNWPDAITWLRSLKTILRDGLTSPISSPVVTAWAIAANVATLTFQNDADHIAFLTALLEDEVHHGSYTGWRTVTLASAIGDITAGTYALTNVNASTRQISFAFTAGNNSGSGTFAADFYAYRIAGSTTTARVFSARGLSIMGANDANLYFLDGGLRRRGYVQGHAHTVQAGIGGGNSNTNVSRLDCLSSSLANTPAMTTIADGTNGTPRVAKETHSPSMSAHLYIHLRRYVA